MFTLTDIYWKPKLNHDYTNFGQLLAAGLNKDPNGHFKGQKNGSLSKRAWAAACLSSC